MRIENAPGTCLPGRRTPAFRRCLLAWFTPNGRAFPWREPEASPYLLLVVEILLQRTRAETVRAFLPSFLKRFPSWEAIATCKLDELGGSLKPIGLWRRRAPPLLELAKEMVARAGEWPRDRDELENMPAVGQYVANAVLLFIHDEPHPLMDASMARLLRRYFTVTPEMADIRYDKKLHAVAYKVLAAGNAIYLIWAMLDVAALYCKPRQPVCVACPLRRNCAHARSSGVSSGA